MIANSAQSQNTFMVLNRQNVTSDEKILSKGLYKKTVVCDYVHCWVLLSFNVNKSVPHFGLVVDVNNRF